jgi:hypothetical protein
MTRKSEIRVRRGTAGGEDSLLQGTGINPCIMVEELWKITVVTDTDSSRVGYNFIPCQ